MKPASADSINEPSAEIDDPPFSKGLANGSSTSGDPVRKIPARFG